MPTLTMLGRFSVATRCAAAIPELFTALVTSLSMAYSQRIFIIYPQKCLIFLHFPSSLLRRSLDFSFLHLAWNFFTAQSDAAPLRSLDSPDHHRVDPLLAL